MTCDSESSASQQRGTPVKRKLSEPQGSQIQSSNQNIPSTQTKSQRSEAKRARKMEIETEFRILKSLIPNIANKQQINELEIIDACVNYIEALQDQLNIRSNSSSTHCSSRPQQSVMSAMSAAAAAAAGCQMVDMSDEVNSVGDDLEADLDDYDIEDEENEARTTSKWSSLASLEKENEAGTSEEDDISESSSSSDSESEGEEVEEENNNAASLSESAKKTESGELKVLTSGVAPDAAALTSEDAPLDKEADDAASSKTSSIEDSTGNAERPSS